MEEAGKYPGLGKHWTDDVHFNWKYFQELVKVFGFEEFTNSQAYQVRVGNVSPSRSPWKMHRAMKGGRVVYYCSGTRPQESLITHYDDFFEMNTRNYLCKLEHHGYLVRVRPGVYRVANDEDIENWEENLQ